MKLKDLIILLASIDNHQNIPQREMMDWNIKITDYAGNKLHICAVYCDEDKLRILIDLE